MTLTPAFEIGVWNAWIFTLVYLLYVCVIQIMFRSTSERVAHGAESGRLTKLQAPLMLLMAIYSIFLPIARGTGWFYAGSVIFLVGLIFATLSRADADAAPEGEPFTGGIYRFSRHPLYMGFILIHLGIAIACASWLFIVLTVIFIVMARFVMVIEEASTLEKYGEAYHEYIEKTPRWIGLPKKAKDAGDT